MISNKQYFEHRAVKIGLTHLKIKITEKLQLKIKLAKTKISKSVLRKLCRTFSASNRRLNSKINPLPPEINELAKETFIKSQKDIKRGGGGV